MKALLVDDERLTRQGIVDLVDWDSLGISQVYQADDGASGLQLALEIQPAIILSDVQMPRLSGIEMAMRLEKQLPNAEIIFMSGYSDKAYLKAAIKLKAVSYIEKPLNKTELHEAIAEAKRRYLAKESQEKTTAVYLDSIHTQLANLLMKPYDQVESQITQLSQHTKPMATVYVTAFSLRTDQSPLPSLSALQVLAQTQGIHLLVSDFHRGRGAIFALTKLSMRPATAQWLAQEIFQRCAPHCSLHLAYAIGAKNGLSGGYGAYTKATALVERCFFHPQHPIMSQELLDSLAKPERAQISFPFTRVQFSKALTERNQEQAMAYLQQGFAYFLESPTETMDNGREQCYHGILTIQEAMQSAQLGMDDLFPREEPPILEQLEKQLTIEGLHNLLVTKTLGFFHLLDSRVSQSSTIYLIKDFISKHYMDENLSAKEIADFVDFSMAYLCTYFKGQTGQTPNQYLTEYRMEKAKQFLADGRNRVTEVSTMVGYRDGNYFSKSFKKHTGLSPSQYREQVIL